MSIENEKSLDFFRLFYFCHSAGGFSGQQFEFYKINHFNHI